MQASEAGHLIWLNWSAIEGRTNYTMNEANPQPQASLHLATNYTQSQHTGHNYDTV